MHYTTTFKDLKKFWEKSSKIALRNTVRDLAMDLLVFKKNILKAPTVYKKPRIHLLYIHHIFKDEVKNFDSLLQFLSKDHTFISHSEAVERIAEGKIDKPYISFSSDDGIKNNLKAAEILNKYNAKACFFINPKTIDLNSVAESTKFCADRLEMPPVEFLNWNDVNSLIEQGHEIGAHTMEHDDVAKLTPEAFKQDLLDCKEIITQKCGSVKHFAYTYGTYENFNKIAHDIVFETGYESCATGVRGAHISNGQKLEKNKILLRRDHIIGAWKLNHMKFFINQSALSANLENNFIPEGWK